MIRNLPQLQKLDNAVVQPDDMAEAMRRGIELVHPLDRDTAYAPPQSMGYSQVCKITQIMGASYDRLFKFTVFTPTRHGVITIHKTIF